MQLDEKKCDEIHNKTLEEGLKIKETSASRQQAKNV